MSLDSDRDSDAELSPDADDEASPQHSPLGETDRLSPSPERIVGQDPDHLAELDGEQQTAMAISPSSGPTGMLPIKDPPHAATDFPVTDDHPAGVDGAVADPDVEGIPEALSMPRDMMPSEDAFEDEGLTTLERIFLLSRSEHAFHR